MAMAANPSNVIALAQPLIVSKDEIDEGIGIFDQAQEEQTYIQKLSFFPLAHISLYEFPT